MMWRPCLFKYLLKLGNIVFFGAREMYPEI